MKPEGSLPCSQASTNSEALCHVSEQAAFTVRNCWLFGQPLIWRITPYRLSTTVYSESLGLVVRNGSNSDNSRSWLSDTV